MFFLDKMKEDNKITDFIEDLRNILKMDDAPEHEKELEKTILDKFNELKDYEKVAIIMSVVNDSKFHLDEHPLVYNTISLIKMKKMLLFTVCTILLITWMSLATLPFLPDSTIIEEFFKVLRFIKDHFLIIFS